MPKIPPKKIIGNIKTKFVEGRRVKLQQYVRELIELHPKVLNNKVFQSFCDLINPTSPCKILSISSPSFFFLIFLLHSLITFLLALGAFACIPEKLLMHIFSYLNIRDLGYAVPCTCKYWHRMSEDDEMWKAITLRTFTVCF
jgi:hypothetical protein